MVAFPLSRRHSSDVDSRGQTATIGLILVFGMVLAGAVLIVTFGSTAIDQVQGGLSDQRAQKAMTQFDSKSALVALGNADTQAIEFPQRGGENLQVQDSAGEMTIRIEEISGPTVASKSWTLGALVLQGGDSTLAYQGGGVWRKSDETRESVMISPPEFHFRNGTLTLPIITVDGETSVGERVSVADSSTKTWFPDPNASPSRVNPLDDHTVFVTVQSEYYKGWGRYFEERTDGEVSYNHGANEVTLKLVTPLGRATVSEGLAGLSSGSLTISGNTYNSGCGPGGAYVDSYNSTGTTAGYCSQPSGEHGNLTYGGDVNLGGAGGGGDIKGSIRSGGDIEMNNDGWNVFEDIFHVGSCMVTGGPHAGPCGSATTKPFILDDPAVDDVHPISAVQEKPVLNNVVDSKVNTISDPANNANNLVGAISPTNQISFAASPVTLPGGHAYFLDHLYIPPGKTLRIDACGAPSPQTTIVVDKDFELHRSGSTGARLVVDDSSCDNQHTVKVFVGGDTGPDGDDHEFFLSRASKVLVPNDDAPQFRVFGKETFDAQLSESGGSNRGQFTGVIYAPVGADDPNDGEVMLKKVDVFGGIVTGDTLVPTKAMLHYDEALKNKQIISRSSKVVKVTFLHVSKNNVVISG